MAKEFQEFIDEGIDQDFIINEIIEEEIVKPEPEEEILKPKSLRFCTEFASWRYSGLLKK